MKVFFHYYNSIPVLFFPVFLLSHNNTMIQAIIAIHTDSLIMKLERVYVEASVVTL